MPTFCQAKVWLKPKDFGDASILAVFELKGVNFTSSSITSTTRS
jgi:hypothetical protein